MILIYTLLGLRDRPTDNDLFPTPQLSFASLEVKGNTGDHNTSARPAHTEMYLLNQGTSGATSG